MKKSFSSNFSTHQSWLSVLLIILLCLGIFFRIYDIENKLYWHDEVYTTIRAAGFTGEEMGAEIFINKYQTPKDLSKYQAIKTNSSYQDVINSLAIEDPQHPPAYFLITRLWMQLFGNSLTALRSLAILISLISLLLIYLLAQELFQDQLAAILSTIFLALSPFDILFSQIARQYSLFTLTVILSSLFFLKALKNNDLKNWLFYSLSCTLGLYTHLFFILMPIANFCFIVINTFKRKENWQSIKSFMISAILTIILYSPWLWVLVNNYQRAFTVTSWAYSPLDWVYNLKLWTLSFTSLLIDINLDFNALPNYLLRLPYLILIAMGIYTIYKNKPFSTTLFITTSIFIPFILLAVPDILLESRRSTITRYLICSFPAIQLSIAYLFANKLRTQKLVWRILFGMVITLSIVSNVQNAIADSGWAKIPSHGNKQINQIINAQENPLLIGDRGDDYTGLGDLLSLNYFFKANVKLLILSTPPNLEKLRNVFQENHSEIFIFRPSQSIKNALKQLGKIIEPVPSEGNLWKIKSEK